MDDNLTTETTAGLALNGQQEGTNPALAALSDLHGDVVATFSSVVSASP
jgi:hypothetical protein